MDSRYTEFNLNKTKSEIFPSCANLKKEMKVNAIRLSIKIRGFEDSGDVILA